MSGVLIGENFYGLTYIGDTTYPPFRWGEAFVCVALLAATARRLNGPRARFAAVTMTVLTAVAFVGIYSRNLNSVVP